jgi:hypothetical protein
MQFEIGIGGLGLLAAISAVFGVLAQVVFWRGVRWMWLAGAIGWFVGGLFASEFVWGTMTINEIQPIIDGLALDESLLGGLISGLATIFVVRFLTTDRAVRGRLSA